MSCSFCRRFLELHANEILFLPFPMGPIDLLCNLLLLGFLLVLSFERCSRSKLLFIFDCYFWCSQIVSIWFAYFSFYSIDCFGLMWLTWQISLFKLLVLLFEIFFFFFWIRNLKYQNAINVDIHHSYWLLVMVPQILHQSLQDYSQALPALGWENRLVAVSSSHLSSLDWSFLPLTWQSLQFQFVTLIFFFFWSSHFWHLISNYQK